MKMVKNSKKLLKIFEFADLIFQELSYDKYFFFVIALLSFYPFAVYQHYLKRIFSQSYAQLYFSIKTTDNKKSVIKTLPAINE